MCFYCTVWHTHITRRRKAMTRTTIIHRVFSFCSLAARVLSAFVFAVQYKIYSQLESAHLSPFSDIQHHMLCFFSSAAACWEVHLLFSLILSPLPLKLLKLQWRSTRPRCLSPALTPVTSRRSGIRTFMYLFLSLGSAPLSRCAHLDLECSDSR